MVLLEGKTVADSVKKELAKEIEALVGRGRRKPHLAVIIVGNNGASETYVASKVKSCTEVGMVSTLIRLRGDLEEKELLEHIHTLNQQEDVDGILVQLPLPKQIDESHIIEAIHPSKDVDGFHPVNAGRLSQGLPAFIPATPYGIILMLQYYQLHTKGKRAMVIGRSNIVGRPMSILLSSNAPYGNATVTLCHSHTIDLESICLEADILVVALGKPGFVKGNMVKQGAVVIDVGITRITDPNVKKGYRIVGDVDFVSVAEKAGYLTPVPGGVGLMTIAGLLKNTLNAYYRRENIDISQ